MIEILNYLAVSTRPDIIFTVYQYACFYESPTLDHTKNIKHIGQYLLKTENKSIIFDPKTSDCLLTCYANADFAGNWIKNYSINIIFIFSRTGYVILFIDCSII